MNSPLGSSLLVASVVCCEVTIGECTVCSFVVGENKQSEVGLVLGSFLNK